LHAGYAERVGLVRLQMIRCRYFEARLATQTPRFSTSPSRLAPPVPPHRPSTTVLVGKDPYFPGIANRVGRSLRPMGTLRRMVWRGYSVDCASRRRTCGHAFSPFIGPVLDPQQIESRLPDRTSIVVDSAHAQIELLKRSALVSPPPPEYTLDALTREFL